MTLNKISFFGVSAISTPLGRFSVLPNDFMMK